MRTRPAVIPFREVAVETERLQLEIGLIIDRNEPFVDVPLIDLSTMDVTVILNMIKRQEHTICFSTAGAQSAVNIKNLISEMALPFSRRFFDDFLVRFVIYISSCL